MTAQRHASLIDGRAVAEELRAKVAAQVAALKAQTGQVPGLAVVLVGDDAASEVYVRNKNRQTQAAGMMGFEHRLLADTPQVELLALVERLNADPKVHGILVQLPLPDHIDARAVINAIDPAKDVDGFHVTNVGLLGTGQKAMLPCTPLGCLILLRQRFSSLSGLNALVIGRSNIVGKPMAQLLLAEDCTVTIAHRHSRDLPDLCSQADIVVAAVGRPGLIKGEWLKPDAVVIDVGINRIEHGGKSKLVGDVDFASAQLVAGAITPVPGGVGPMTIACLLANTLTAFCRTGGLPDPEGLIA